MTLLEGTDRNKYGNIESICQHAGRFDFLVLFRTLVTLLFFLSGSAGMNSSKCRPPFHDRQCLRFHPDTAQLRIYHSSALQSGVIANSRAFLAGYFNSSGLRCEYRGTATNSATIDLVQKYKNHSALGGKTEILLYNGAQNTSAKSHSE